MKYKIIFCSLAILLLFAGFASAEEEVSYDTSNVPDVAKSGDEYTVSVTVNAPSEKEISGFIFGVSYDPEKSDVTIDNSNGGVLDGNVNPGVHTLVYVDGIEDSHTFDVKVKSENDDSIRMEVIKVIYADGTEADNVSSKVIETKVDQSTVKEPEKAKSSSSESDTSSFISSVFGRSDNTNKPSDKTSESTDVATAASSENGSKTPSDTPKSSDSGKAPESASEGNQKSSSGNESSGEPAKTSAIGLFGIIAGISAAGVLMKRKI